jgi:hypothetical protein
MANDSRRMLRSTEAMASNLKGYVFREIRIALLGAKLDGLSVTELKQVRTEARAALRRLVADGEVRLFGDRYVINSN